jgi:hypothetical protein
MDRVEHLFVVRIWFEAGANGRSAWRGSVEHVDTGARRYFSALAELDAFILRSTDDPVRADEQREGA